MAAGDGGGDDVVVGARDGGTSCAGVVGTGCRMDGLDFGGGDAMRGDDEVARSLYGKVDSSNVTCREM